MDKIEKIGKIYKLINSENDKIYVGSTESKYLSKRMAHHREQLERTPNCGKLYPAMTEIGVKKFKIVLLEMIKFIDKDELRAKEYEWIKNLDAVENGYNTCYNDKERPESSIKKLSKGIVQSYKNRKCGNRQNDITGISRRGDTKCGRWIAYYSPELGQLKTISFSVEKYGEEEAKEKAIEWRNLMIQGFEKYA